MPTYTIYIRETHQRKDGRYPVSIRLTHQRQSSFISTGLYVQKAQIKRGFTGLKDPMLIKSINEDIVRYERILLNSLGSDLKKYSAKELVKIITNHREVGECGHLSFSGFCADYCSDLRKRGKIGTATRLESVFHNYQSYFGGKDISVKEVNVANIQGFIDFMSKPRKVRYTDKLGREVEMTRSACKPQTIKDYIADLQTLFNAMCDKYNDEDTGENVITHNPFRSKKIKIDVREIPAKRDLTIDEVAQIVMAKNLPTARMELARDVLLLSFYLIAMNTADLYGDDAVISIRRIEYHRQKTKTRRKDEALFSVKIEPEVLPLLRKYRDPKKKRLFNFYTRYSNFRTFNSNVNDGAKALAEHLGWSHNLTTYYMRHSWATIASEDCGLSDEDVALALNHVSIEDDIKRGKSLRITRGYIHRRFKRNDINNRKVLDLIASKVRGQSTKP